MKKMPNLTIAINKTKELYKFYLKLAKKIESEIVGQVKNRDNIAKFTSTISNFIDIKKKGRKLKYNMDHKGKKKAAIKFD